MSSLPYICTTCGVQFSTSESPPAQCAICEDERQYVNPTGQVWTTLEALREEHHNVIKPLEPSLTGLRTSPAFAIGQRALLVQSPQGNILWDCLSLIDDPTVAAVEALGGVAAIAVSHPHFYSAMVEWAHAFDAPIYLPAADERWVMRSDPAIQFWEGESKTLGEGLTVIRCGGHFPGSTVLHWAQGAEGKGALFTSDTITVAADARYVSFMYSYPNLIPLPAATVRQIAAAVEPYEFDRIYGGWRDKIIKTGAKAALARSVERYVEAVEG